MRRHMKSAALIPLALIFIGATVLGLAAYFDVVKIAETIIRAAGAGSLLLGRGLYKLRLLRPLVVVFGASVLLFGLISIKYPFQFRSVRTLWMQARSVKARIFLCLAVLFGAMSCATLAFYGIYTVQSLQQYSGLSEDARLEKEFQHSGYGNAFEVLKTVLRETPADSRLALVCANDISHILHYYLYPRKVFSDLNVRDPSEFARTWIEENEITHIVWLTGFHPHSLRIGSDSMRVQILRADDWSGQHG